MRDKLSGGPLLAHVAHAAREAGYVPGGIAPSENERVCVLIATKAQIETAVGGLRRDGVPFKSCFETAGPMAGTTPSVGISLLLEDKPKFEKYLGHLQPWSDRRQKNAQPDTLSPAEPELSVTKLPARAAHVSEHSGGDPNS